MRSSLAETNARKNLEAGFTTIRDLGADPRLIRALRDGIDKGAILGPASSMPGR
jgi:imidazolonepropionase-like amidohydrolase